MKPWEPAPARLEQSPKPGERGAREGLEQKGKGTSCTSGHSQSCLSESEHPEALVLAEGSWNYISQQAARRKSGEIGPMCTAERTGIGSSLSPKDLDTWMSASFSIQG